MKIFSAKSIIISIFFGILNALSCWLFIVPNSFASSGIEGIGVMIQHLTGFSVGLFQLVVNIPLVIFAYLCVSKKFSVNSLIYSLVYYIAYFVIDRLQLSKFQYNALGFDTIYPVIIVGIITGFSYGILFREYSSTGGIDILARYINKKAPKYNFFYVTFAFNATIAIVSCFIYKQEIDGVISYSYRPACMCLLCDFISNMVGDKIIKGNESAYKYLIISKHIDNIEKRVIKDFQHSATRLDCIGSYTGDVKQILMCVVDRTEKTDFDKMLKQFDDVFVTVEGIDNVFGYFDRKRQWKINKFIKNKLLKRK